MRRKKLKRINGQIILLAGRLFARCLPVGSLLVSNWLFERFQSNKTMVAYRAGHTVLIIPGVASCWRDAVNGREYALQGFLEDLALKVTGFLDCGANIGCFSSFMAGLNPGIKVVAVEPLPECCSYLRAVRRINGFRNIEIVNAVLSDRDKVLKFSLPQEGRFGETGSLGRSAVWNNAISVRGYSLDSLLEKFDTDERVVVKVDIEGFETVALGVPVSRRNAQKVTALCVEMHLNLYEEPWAEFDNLLISLRSWFAADWFVAMPRYVQKPLTRYLNRLCRKEGLMPLDIESIKDLIDHGRIGDLHLFGICRS